MKTRVLGRTGLSVTEIGLSTEPFGLPYPDTLGRMREMAEFDAIALIRLALDRGINLIATARTEGTSESLVGRALRRRQEELIVATELAPLDEAMTDEELVKAVKASIEQSRRALDREILDVLLVPQATAGILTRSALVDTLADAQSRERIRATGVQPADERALEHILEHGGWAILQLAFGVLDQRVESYLAEAQRQELGVIVRSAVPWVVQAQEVPESMASLDRTIREFAKAMGVSHPLHALLLFVLSYPAVSSVLAVVQTNQHLLDYLGVGLQPLFSDDQLAEARAFQQDTAGQAAP